MDPYPMMGYIYSQQRKPELAEKYLKAFVAHRPESWDGQIQIASHYFRNGKPELAIEHYERCIEIDPTQIGAIRELSLALTKAQKPVLARQWMELFQAIDKPEAQRARSGYSEENTGGAGAHK
jgi:tetratricopeptide (TPR) repeat protein